MRCFRASKSALNFHIFISSRTCETLSRDIILASPVRFFMTVKIFSFVSHPSPTPKQNVNLINNFIIINACIFNFILLLSLTLMLWHLLLLLLLLFSNIFKEFQCQTLQFLLLITITIYRTTLAWVLGGWAELHGGVGRRKESLQNSVLCVCRQKKIAQREKKACLSPKKQRWVNTLLKSR